MDANRSNVLAVLLVSLASSAWAHAQTPAKLIFDSSNAPIRFAESNLKESLGLSSYAVSEMPLGAPSGVTQPFRVILTTEDVSFPGKPVTSRLMSQGCAIQHVVDGSATDWWSAGLVLNARSSQFVACSTGTPLRRTFRKTFLKLRSRDQCHCKQGPPLIHL